jgi:hypothetical protein
MRAYLGQIWSQFTDGTHRWKTFLLGCFVGKSDDAHGFDAHCSGFHGKTFAARHLPSLSAEPVAFRFRYRVKPVV